LANRFGLYGYFSEDDSLCPDQSPDTQYIGVIVGRVTKPDSLLVENLLQTSTFDNSMTSLLKPSSDSICDPGMIAPYNDSPLHSLGTGIDWPMKPRRHRVESSATSVGSQGYQEQNGKVGNLDHATPPAITGLTHNRAIWRELSGVADASHPRREKQEFHP
jgi:hypothetical protein